MIKLTKGQTATLVAAALPMAAVGIAGGVATYVNMNHVLHRSASALGLVAAGEGAVLIASLVALAVTLMGQHTPTTVRMALWLIPLLASATGVALAPTTDEAVVMAVTPLAMTAAGEGVAFVARRVVAYRTGVDIEQQRRSGLLLWHANRAANGSGLGKRMSKAAVWRLTRSFAATDGQLSVQLGEIQRYRIGQGADENLAAVLTGGKGRAVETPVRPSEALPLTPAPILNPEVLPALTEAPAAPHIVQSNAEFKGEPTEDNWDFIKSVLEDAEATVAADPSLKLLTGAEVAAMAGVASGTVRSWVSRKKLPVADRDERGAALFRQTDVAKLL